MTEEERAGDIPLAHGTKNGCFGCGDDNETGLRLKFFVDDENRVLCHFRLDRRFQGPPRHAHGGIIATLLDEAMSKANRRRGVTAMTRQLSIDYRRPVPLERDLVLEGWSESDTGRKHRCSAEVRDASGSVLASATGLFIEVKLASLNERTQPVKCRGIAGLTLVATNRLQETRTRWNTQTSMQSLPQSFATSSTTMS